MASHHAWAEPPNWQVVAKLSAEAGNRVNNFLAIEGLPFEVKSKMRMVQTLLFDALAGADAIKTDGQTVRMNVDRALDLARETHLPT